MGLEQKAGMGTNNEKSLSCGTQVIFYTKYSLKNYRVLSLYFLKRLNILLIEQSLYALKYSNKAVKKV